MIDYERAYEITKLGHGSSQLQSVLEAKLVEFRGPSALVRKSASQESMPNGVFEIVSSKS